MRAYTKLPLYLGLAVLVFSVIISVVKIGNQQAFISQNTKAAAAGASLSLKYISPNSVSVLLTSDKEVGGVDVTIKYNALQISILPSSLTSGGLFITSGGSTDDKTGTFTFSGVAKKSQVKDGVVATFNITSKDSVKSADADLQFVVNGTATTVIDKASGQNILNKTQGVKLTFPTNK